MLLRSEAAGVLVGGLSIEIHQIYNVNVIGWLGRLRGLPIKNRFRGCRQPDFHDGAGIPQRAAIRRECTQIGAEPVLFAKAFRVFMPLSLQRDSWRTVNFHREYRECEAVVHEISALP
jgi:hypothetical protein